MSLSLTILVGCGGGNNFWGGSSGGNGGQNSPPPSSFAENWHFDVSTSALTIDAALTLSSNSIVGVAHFQSYTAATDCPAFFDDLPLTGTINTQGQVSAKSSPVKGAVLSLTGTLAPDHASLSNGTYRFSGGCMSGVAGPLTGVKVKPLTGLYTGTMQWPRSEEHTSELQSLRHLVCRLLLEKKTNEHHPTLPSHTAHHSPPHHPPPAPP